MRPAPHCVLAMYLAQTSRAALNSINGYAGVLAVRGRYLKLFAMLQDRLSVRLGEGLSYSVVNLVQLENPHQQRAETLLEVAHRPAVIKGKQRSEILLEMGNR